MLRYKNSLLERILLEKGWYSRPRLTLLANRPPRYRCPSRALREDDQSDSGPDPRSPAPGTAAHDAPRNHEPSPPIPEVPLEHPAEARARREPRVHPAAAVCPVAQGEAHAAVARPLAGEPRAHVREPGGPLAARVRLCVAPPVGGPSTGQNAPPAFRPRLAVDLAPGLGRSSSGHRPICCTCPTSYKHGPASNGTGNHCGVLSDPGVPKPHGATWYVYTLLLTHVSR